MEIQLVHDLLSVGFNRLHADIERGGHLLRRSAFGNKLKDLPFSPRNAAAHLAMAGRPVLYRVPDHQVRYRRAEIRLSLHSYLEGNYHLIKGRLFQKVCRSAGSKSLQYGPAVRTHRKNDDFDRGAVLVNLFCSVDAIQTRHADIDNNGVGL